MKSLKIACIGEAMIELQIDSAVSNARVAVAGDSINTAIYLARCLGNGHEVAFISMIGKDPLSDRIADFISGEGISTEFLKRHDTRLPGLYSISTNSQGERSFSYWREASAARLLYASPDQPGFEELNGFDVVFLSAISLAILPKSVRDRFFEWIKTFKSDGGLFVFDSNYRPALWPSMEEARLEVTRAWSCCDIALPSADDEMALFGDKVVAGVLERLSECGVKTGALKRGELGPVPIGCPELALPEFPPAEAVIDTTAAGDSFNGAFLASYLTTGDLAGSMKAGHEMASVVVAHRGAIIPRQAEFLTDK